MEKKLLFVLSALFFLGSCATHYSTPDGAYLEIYSTPEGLYELIQFEQEEIRIIDVRPQSAYERAHVPSAEGFPSSEIMDRLDELPVLGSYIFYCETGGRAQLVINKLEDEGYTILYNWGGFGRWPNDYPTESGL